MGQTNDIYGGLRGVRLARLYGGDRGGFPAAAGTAGAGIGAGAIRGRPYAHTRRAANGAAPAHGRGGNRAGNGNGGIGRWRNVRTCRATDGDACANAYTHPDVDANTYTCANADTHPDPDAHPDADPEAHADAHPDTDAKAHAYACAYRRTSQRVDADAD